MSPEKIQLLSSGNFDLERYFSEENKSPFEFGPSGNKIKWAFEDVSVTDMSGNTIFTQKNIRKPDFWSSLALKVVASKYFWGDLDKGEREEDIEKIISRISKFFSRQTIEQAYFSENTAKILEDEISAICLNQLAVFNSPVWFNVGIQGYNKDAGGVSAFKWDSKTDTIHKAEKTEDRPQCSACFIQSVEDDMDSIMELQRSEVNLFKAGSGTGSNRSAIRSSKEKITGGGSASGPVSFMKGYDSYAGIIKSGGKTRRAAKMEILNIDHPDILEFINSKQEEERKAWALIEQGYDGSMDGPAYGSVAFQNCNMSVRATDEFMQAAKSDSDWSTKYVKSGEICETFKAKEILRKIAEGTHTCGDPGLQFDTTINRWHTCKNSGHIRASNPCSEYMFIDDSACNLSSINLMKFRTASGDLDLEAFKRTVKTMIVAMDLIVDGGSYPAEKIARNSRDFRPLGLGYANLGALLMSLGLPYDSDSGRALAAVITAVMSAEAYKTSAELAANLGSFPRYEENKDCMLKVIEMHKEEVKKIDYTKLPENFKNLVNEAWDSWEEALELGKKFGYRNSQTTLLAPTGTIAFMMDCDTTGIEPDIALVKYKVLAGGGMLKIINNSVPLALKNLSYTEDQVKEIIEYIDKNDTIEGSSINSEHLPIFDCAFKSAKGVRSIHYEGHIKMMSAIQPFLSGAISKTVNMSEDATLEDIEKAYMLAWELGLKSVAIYRENSKRIQPLNTKKEETKEETIGKRVRLPQTRYSITHKFSIADHEGYLTVGLYEHGVPGEIFITMSKEGSTIRGLMDAWATSVSINLQHGVSIKELFGKFRHQKFEPSGFVRNEHPGELDGKLEPIRTASSVVDYVSQFMLARFSNASKLSKNPELELSDSSEDQEKDFGNEGLVCPLCGGPAKRISNCSILCTSCNQASRSGCGE